MHSHVLLLVLPPHCGLSEPYPPEKKQNKTQMFIPYVTLMLLELFEKIKILEGNFFKKCIRELFFEGILECFFLKVTFLGFH